MARRPRKHKAPKPSEAIALDEAASRAGRWGWFISFLMLISVAEGGPFQTVRVLPTEVDAVLAPEWAWESPILWLSSLEPLAECPYWLYAAVVSFLITRFLRARFQSGPAEFSESGIAPIILAALSLQVRPVELVTATIVVGAAKILTHPCSDGRSRGRSIGLVTAVVAAVTLCVDFSIVLFFLLIGWLRHSSGCLSVRQTVAVLTGVAIVCGLGLICFLGFAEAFARPVTWWRVAENHVPMIPSSGDGFLTWIPLGLTVVVVIHSWCLAWSSARRQSVQLLALLAFSLLALTCRYYHWVSLLGVVSCTDYAEPNRRTFVRGRLLRWCLVPIVLLSLASQFESYRSFALTGRWPRQFVDPVQWNTSGRVMLMQPEFSSRWQSERLSNSFRLIVDDRWDLFSARYRNYQLVCRDLSEFRSSRYIRSDGTWGGYRQWTEKWKPTLLVVDSSDLDGIRRLALSPDWNVVGIDSHRTILAAAGEPKNANQIRTAGRLLSELEWPSPKFDGSYGNVLVASGSTARMKVARVLLAMRLPYAALRVMPEAADPSHYLSAMCHFEISHRIFRHTHTHSLLDQYRAIYHLRLCVDSNQLSATQLIRIARGLEGLSEPGTAIEFVKQLSEQSGFNTPQERQWATELIVRCEPQVADELRVGMQKLDASIRRALRSGDLSAVNSCLKTMVGREREFFEVLASAISNSPEDVYRELIALLNAPDFPNRLRGEALFYLGSLAIEIGDSPSAATAFSASIQVEPSHSRNSISRVSLMNLQKNSR